MSAICGIFLRNKQKVNNKLIKKMNDSLIHRGPDGSNTWNEGPVGLGHQMLHTTPESLDENLPFEDVTEKVVITADARIDNRDELLNAFNMDNSAKISDSELILEAYIKWGENCPDRLLGDFAFVIWDYQNQILFCARDHMGIKPFYYYISDNAFYFATEIKALFKIIEVPKILNEDRIGEYLISFLEDRQITFFKDLIRLPAAHKLIVNFEQSYLSQYWKLDPKLEVLLESDKEYADVFRDIFTKAVQCRLRSAFPQGSMLSGGLDSSSIACTASEIMEKEGNDHLKTFSAIFSDIPECDESLFIKSVLDKYDFDSYFIDADNISPLTEISKILFLEDEPFHSTNLYILWLICKQCNENNVRVILDGLSGDDVVSHGEGYLKELVHKKEYKKLYNEIKGISERFNLTFYETISLIFITLIPENFKKILRKFKGGNEYPFISNNILNQDFANKIDLKKRIQMKCEDLNRKKTAKEIHFNSLNSGFDQIVLEMQDKISAPFLVEICYPFLDKRLVEFCYAVPTEQKRHNGWDRIIMRRAMEDILPLEIQWRKDKKYFGKSFRINFIKFEKDFIEDTIFKEYSVIEDYVNVDVLNTAYNEYKDNYKEIDEMSVYNIWKSIILELWISKMDFKN